MNLASIFEAVKAAIPVRAAAERYGLEVNCSSMVRCPFHEDRTPSMKLYEEHFFCFGCGKHGDVVTLVSELFGIPPYDAARKLADDFGVDSDAETVRTLAREYLRSFREDLLRCQRVLSAYLRLLTDWKERFAPTDPNTEPDDSVRIEPCDEPSCRTYKFRYIVTHGWLTARERDLGDLVLLKDRDYLLPFFSRKFLFLCTLLVCRIAVNAFLITMPVPVFCHGGNHKIHPVRSSHVDRILSECHDLAFNGYRLSFGDRLECSDKIIEVLLKDIVGYKMEYFPDTFECLLKYHLKVVVRHRARTEFIDVLYVFGKKDRLRLNDGKDILAVDDDYGIHCLKRSELRRDHMHPYNAWAVRIPRGMDHAFPVSEFIDLLIDHLSYHP